MEKIKKIIYGAGIYTLSAINVLAEETTKSSSSWNLSDKFGGLLTGIDSNISGMMTYAYDNLSRLAIAVPILVIFIIIISKSGLLDEGGRKNLTEALGGEHKIKCVLTLFITGIIAAALVYGLGTKFVL